MKRIPSAPVLRQMSRAGNTSPPEIQMSNSLGILISDLTDSCAPALDTSTVEHSSCPLGRKIRADMLILVRGAALRSCCRGVLENKPSMDGLALCARGPCPHAA